MKKTTAVLVALMPVVYCLIMQAANLFHMGDELFLGALGVYTLLGILLAIVYSRACYRCDKLFLAANSLWFYGGNWALFIAQIVLWCIRLEETRIAEQNGAMEGGLGLVLLILIYLPHWISYLATRIAGAVSCARILKGLCSPTAVLCHVILQILPGTDFISSIWVYKKVKQSIPT